MQYRTALITGASSGIGRSLACCLAKDGTEVVLCARRVGELQQAAEEIRSAGGKARVLEMDVTDSDRTVAAIRQADQELNGLDLIVANAGVGVVIDAKRMTWEQIRTAIRVNFEGAVATLMAVLPQ